MIVTFHKDGASLSLNFPDDRCDELLDRLSARMPVNEDMDRRWLAMMAKREAAARAAMTGKKRAR